MALIQYLATGRRKQATARIFLRPGTGKITVNGSVGGWSGDDMKGGLIEVHGDAGDYLASPYRGTATGMKGGLIVIDGKK